MSTPDLIIEGIRRIESWSRIVRGAGDLSARYERADDYEAALAQMSLSFEKLSILTSLNGTLSVEAICSEATLPDFEVCRTLWAFRVLGVIRRVDTPARPEGPAEDEGLGVALAGDEP
jgi:hypothetical protein